jgi:hypothetical protein
VTAALERRDRNRSDEHFRGIFLSLFDRDDGALALNPRHLYLVVPDEALTADNAGTQTPPASDPTP